jgi:hypothetical protein
VHFIAFVAEVIEKRNQLGHDMFNFFKGLLEVSDAAGGELFPISVLFCVVLKEGGLVGLLEVVLEVVDIVP